MGLTYMEGLLTGPTQKQQDPSTRVRPIHKRSCWKNPRTLVFRMTERKGAMAHLKGAPFKARLLVQIVPKAKSAGEHSRAN